ncbi:MAG: GDP-L-fucose synthase, partial [Opitutales bacterium]
PPDWVNLGCGEEITIADLARLVMKVTGYQGELTFDTSKPDGTPRKLTDISKIKATGWAPKIPIDEGVALAYQSFLQEKADGSLRE